MDDWGLDAVVSASQKALALPPGLGFAAVSERLRRARQDRRRTAGVYLDPLRYEEFTGKSQSPTTPAVSLLFALDQQLADIELETLDSAIRAPRGDGGACAAWVERAEADRARRVAPGRAPDVVRPR